MIQKDCNETKGDSGKMWKVINSEMKSKDKPNIVPDFVKVVAADGKAGGGQHSNTL